MSVSLSGPSAISGQHATPGQAFLTRVPGNNSMLPNTTAGGSREERRWSGHQQPGPTGDLRNQRFQTDDRRGSKIQQESLRDARHHLSPSDQLRSPPNEIGNHWSDEYQHQHQRRCSRSPPRHSMPQPANRNLVHGEQHSTWRAPSDYTHATIMDLVELFFEIVYPIFPLFHQPTFIRRVSRAEYNTNKSLFAVTMAVCALVSARVRDGAVFNPRWDLQSLQPIAPEVYYNESIRQVKGDHTDLNTLRTHALLALAAIQDGKFRDMHGHLGRYHTIVASEGLHDENNWPSDIGLVETQERRRLFWSIYTLDIFTSIVWGGVIRSREYQSSVSYPSEVDDDMFDDTGFATGTGMGSSADSTSASWMAGRNFVIDLYRVLEHIIMRLSVRKSRAQRQTLIDSVLPASDSLSQEAVLNSVMSMYGLLPQCLKETNPITSKPRLDRFGFQAADIVATVQLLRMTLLSATGGSIFEKCQIANEVVNAFSAIPTGYHHAISVPLLFHLGVIGQILATTLEQRLSENEYRSIRDVMMAMAQLLSTLEGLHASKGASQRLKDQITRIDDFMTVQRHNTRGQSGRPNAPAETPNTLRQREPGFIAL
ncbi:hypothetical protein TI39_contig42g00011 [Zymoseptoria brevis]|uniref:Xylanolytic transcriptional activator regulatory domain-containing protein n=1 Tax=Zymoseptoria brevis TaxID=1047168 RepID=A0A0F4GYT0_9PEZI|nr:hypothetical protein TI39_contig42g00011 [Zymoseptoria brevis]